MLQQTDVRERRRPRKASLGAGIRAPGRRRDIRRIVQNRHEWTPVLRTRFAPLRTVTPAGGRFGWGRCAMRLWVALPEHGLCPADIVSHHSSRTAERTPEAAPVSPQQTGGRPVSPFRSGPSPADESTAAAKTASQPSRRWGRPLNRTPGRDSVGGASPSMREARRDSAQWLSPRSREAAPELRLRGAGCRPTATRPVRRGSRTLRRRHRRAVRAHSLI
jgi:hypothetical protein